jgi:hypothetical protein
MSQALSIQEFISALRNGALDGGALELESLYHQVTLGIKKVSLDAQNNLHVLCNWTGTIVSGQLQPRDPINYMQTSMGFATHIESRGENRWNIEFHLGDSRWTWFFHPPRKGQPLTIESIRGF